MYHRIYYPTKIKGLELKSEYENTTLLPKGQTHKTEELKKKKKRPKDQNRESKINIILWPPLVVCVLKTT